MFYGCYFKTFKGLMYFFWTHLFCADHNCLPGSKSRIAKTRPNLKNLGRPMSDITPSFSHQSFASSDFKWRR